MNKAHPGGRAVCGVCLRSLTCWHYTFESHCGHGRLSLVSVVRCRVEVSARGRSLVHRSPTVRACSRARACVRASLGVIKCRNDLYTNSE
jgi:hypothetical protein